jgi:hypothetical protein
LEEVKRDLTGQLSNVTELEHIVPTVLKILHNFRDGCVTILSFLFAKLKMVKFEFSLSAVFWNCLLVAYSVINADRKKRALLLGK